MNMNYVVPKNDFRQKLNRLRSEVNSCLDLLDDVEQPHTENRSRGIVGPRTFLSLSVEILKLRRKRESIFGGNLFQDPVWDMLLSLYVDEQHGRRIGVSSLSIASGVPATTAHRYIEIMCSRGLITRKLDLNDRRRTELSLTKDAVSKIEQVLTMAMSI